MARRWIGAGLMGAIVLVLWTFLVNGLLGFRARMELKPVPGERAVYEVLKRQVTEPGRYTCNPALSAEGRFPDHQPVFSILYGGMGHEAAGWLMPVGLGVFLAAPLIGAWLLSQASVQVLTSYPRKVLFFTAIGALLAVFGDLTDLGIGGYPPVDAVILALHDIALWTVVGLVVAWRLRPPEATA